MSADLPAEIWHTSIFCRTANDVHGLQRLRAVNRSFRELVDARVVALTQSIQQHASQSTPPNVSLHVSTRDLSSTQQALETAANWVLLACVADKRARRERAPEARNISVCDMLGKSFMYAWTASMFGKLSLSASHPTAFRPLAEKMYVRQSRRPIWDAHESDRDKTEQVVFDNNKHAWIRLTTSKLCCALPENADTPACKDKIAALLTRAMFALVVHRRVEAPVAA